MRIFGVIKKKKFKLDKQHKNSSSKVKNEMEGTYLLLVDLVLLHWFCFGTLAVILVSDFVLVVEWMR